MKFIVLFSLFLSFLASAQDTLDVRFLGTQRTASTPFSLPISINSKGEISLFGDKSMGQLSFRPIVQSGFNYVNIEYSKPVILNRFNFYPIQKDLGWVEVKRVRVEAGLGLSSIIKSAATVGFMPYKGAMRTLIRHKTSKLEKSLPFQMPKKLQDLAIWNENDIGTFQTYGGIFFYAGFSSGIIDFASGQFGIQNQFIIEMRKLNEKEVVLKITEEKLKTRHLVVGPFTTQGTVGNFEGKRLSAEFSFDLDIPEHHELFSQALQGNLADLQSRMPSKSQKLSWTGRDRSIYFGIPVVAGKIIDAGHYDMNENGVETELDFRGSKNKGFLTPHRAYQDFAYLTDEGMVIIWSSEMNKTNEKVFNRRFLSKGRIIGIKGFDRDLPSDTKFGSVVSQIGIHITRKELQAVNSVNMDDVEFNLRDKCIRENLSCRKTGNLKNIMAKLKALKDMNWKDMRRKLGLLLIKEPAVIYAVVKTMKYEKEVYFKFLSEKYQSLEGSSPIEI